MALLLLLPGIACRGAEKSLSEADFINDLPVVLSASRLPQAPSDVPGAMTVIDRESIAASGAREIADLLRLVPGMLVGYSNGHFPAVAYHAYHDDYARLMQVLVDGRSIYTPYFVGGVDWSGLGLALDDIERIEVFRGTNSVTYGANATLGVINIITRPASDGAAFRVDGAGGTGGIGEHRIRLSARDDYRAVRLTYGQRRDHGFNQIEDGQRREFLNLRGDFVLANDTALMVHAGGQNGRFQEGFAGVPSDPPHAVSKTTSFFQAKLTRQFDVGNEVTVHYYRNHEAARERVNASFSPFLPSLDVFADRDATRDDVELVHLWTIGHSTRVAWGAEARQDSISSRLLFGSDRRQKVNLFRLFGNIEWRLADPLVLNAGLMREDYGLHQPTLAYRAFLNYRLNGENTLRGGVATGYRTASLFEQRANWSYQLPGPLLVDQFYQASGNLKPEKVLTHEFGYRGDLRALATSVDLRVFHETATQVICRYERALSGVVELDPANATYDFTNCEGHYTVEGVELAWQWHPFSGTRLTFNSLWSARQWTMQPPASATTQYARILYFPPRIMSALIEQQLPWRTVVGAAWYRVKAPHVGGTLEPDFYSASGATQPQSYRRLDLRLARKIRIGESTLEMAMVAQNLGAAYDEFQPGVRFNRRLMASLAIEY